MDTTGIWFFLILVAAVAAGFGIGRWRAQAAASVKAVNPPGMNGKRYLEGLNQLLTEQPDAAIDTFVATLEVNEDTLETHFALGNLLRKRGEVDRAIRIHENLLARPDLSAHHQEQAKMALALDYKKLGLLDRAEVLFTELSQAENTARRVQSLENLVQIYQEEQEWQRAITAAEALCDRKLKTDLAYWRRLQSHFCCELAEWHLQKNTVQSAWHWAREALNYRRDAPRAALLMCRLELLEDHGEEALKWLDTMAWQPECVSLLLPLAEACHEKLGRSEDLYGYLAEIYQQTRHVALVPVLACSIYEKKGNSAAIEFLQHELQNQPPLASLAQALALSDKHSLNFEALKPVVEEFMPDVFLCGSCGFAGQEVHWSCPTCRAWL